MAQLAESTDLTREFSGRLVSVRSRDGQPRPKILFLAEDMTLAHVGRIITLAGGLDPRRYDVVVGCGHRYAHFVQRAGLRHVHMESMDSEYFNDRLARGLPVHSTEILQKYVRDDLALIAAERPDAVVGDFRVSLGISAELANVTYVNVVNAYWSPKSSLEFPMPEHPSVRIFGLTLAKMFAPLVVPLSFGAYLKPFNQLREAFGLKPFGSLQEMYTHGTHTLYPDIPELAPVDELPPNHHFAGPLLWEPQGALPAWWDALPQDRPVIYLNVGSSGIGRKILDDAVKAYADQPVSVMVATAHTELVGRLPDNFYVTSFLPGIAAAARSSLVVCNGGSGTIYQAVSQGVPVLCVPSNLDQYYATEAAVNAGAAAFIRAGYLNAARLLAETQRVLQTPSFNVCAEALAVRMAERDPVQVLEGLLQSHFVAQAAA